MFYNSIFLILFKNIQIVHCRSHVPAIVGFFFKKKIFKIKLIFDFRGLWIEERFDYNILSKKKNYIKFILKSLRN